MEEVIIFFNELHSEVIGLYLEQQHLDTTAPVPATKRLVQVLGIVADFEWAGRE
ncbi:MAG TPA: hypothetical protein VN657_00890 [Nitrospiraceae bacterium]|nr:hypothetical protein [Nitrospiraceae bacterium]